MTIRHHCEQCGQLLKIKDDLAGTPNKCPACKHQFIVPMASTAEDSHVLASPPANPASAQSPPASAPAEVSELAGESPVVPSAGAAIPTAAPVAAPASAAPRAKGARKGGDDFDPVAFLMDDDGAKKSGARTPSGGKEANAPSAPPPSRKWGSRTTEMPEPDPVKEMGGSSPASRARSSSGGSGGGGGGGEPKIDKVASAANAKEMLKKAMKDARGKSEEMPTGGEQGERLDIKALLQEIGAAKLGIILGVIVLSGAFYWWASQPNLDVPPRGFVSGRVTLDGQPLAGAIVNFLPQEKEYRKEKTSKHAIGIRTASGVTDADGRYTLNYIETYRGTFVGKNFIYLSPLMSDAGRDRIPASWSLSSLGFPEQVKTVDVAEGSNPNFDIEMKSDPVK